MREALGNADYRSGERAFQTLRFFIWFKKQMSFKREVRKMIREIEATRWRLRECIWVRELAASQRLERMRRLRMLKEKKVWKREAGFDRTKIIAEMREQHFLADFDPEPLYSNYITRDGLIHRRSIS